MMRCASAIIVAALLAGCGGGGRGAVSSPPAINGISPVSLQLVIPSAASAQSSGIRPLYVSRATQGLGISYGVSPATFPAATTPNTAVNVSAGSSLCVVNSDGSRTCTIPIAAPTGSVDFQVTAWDAVPVSGSFASAHRLSGTTVTKTISAGQANSLSFTLDGVVNNIALFVTPATLGATTSGTNQTATLSVNATDFAGNIIIGSGNYTDANGNPLTISIGQSIVSPGGPMRTTLSSNTVTSSAANTVTVTYPGGSTYGTKFTPTPSIPIAGISSAATLTVSPTVTEFSAGGNQPQDITTGPDGNIWYTLPSSFAVGQITPAGSVTTFLPGFAPAGITVGPDGNLWLAGKNGNDHPRIAKVTPSGAVTVFSTGITDLSDPIGIAAGPDGNLWFAENNNDTIGRITTAGVVTEFHSGISAGSFPLYITKGPDGAMWFTEDVGQIGRITTSGVVTEYSTGITPGAELFGITNGPDGNLWFTECNLDQIGRITPSGTITEFSLGISAGCNPFGITSGPDGNLWFAENTGDRIGRITPTGAVTEFSTGITASSGPFGITVGPDGNLWFTEETANNVGRFIY